MSTGHRTLRASVVGEFESAGAMLDAIERLRVAGVSDMECYSPFEVSGAAERLRLSRSRLPLFVFAAAVVGAAVSYGVQWYASAGEYPQNAGGRPVHAVPSFIFSTFEGMVLVAALAAVVGLMFILRLPRLSHPIFEVDGFERATVDRFWVAIDIAEAPVSAGRCARILRDAGALRIIRQPEMQ